MKKYLYLGIDIGSVSIKVVLLTSEGKILRTYYRRSKGQPLFTLKHTLGEIFGDFNPGSVRTMAATGTALDRESGRPRLRSTTSWSTLELVLLPG